MLAMSLPMTAERVTPETARKVASTFLTNNGAKSAQLTDLSKEAGFPNLYIFTAEQGFVVMAADDCVQPILGYSLDGFILAEDMPDNVRGWLQDYNDEIQFAIDNRMRATAKTAKQWKDLMNGNTKAGRATPVVAPLIQTQWNQNGGYYGGTYVFLFNNLCPPQPNNPSRNCATGCVATAMAQIMKYHSYPQHGIGSHSYFWNNQTLSADFGSTNYNWSHMTNTYGKNSTDTEKEAVAKLMYHCGISVDMSYGSSSSASTAAVVEALKTYFNYSPDIVYKSKGDYNNGDWSNMVKTELDEGRPLQYRGSTGTGGGHSFVCDGYDDSDYFHFNWGWAGSLDGYFLLNNLNTGANTQTGAGNGDYTNNQAAIFGIQPATIGEAAAPTLTANLVQGAGIRNVNLTWTAVSDAASYQLYHNCQLIYSGTETTFTHEHIPYGTSTYFVRTVDASGNLSWPSNYATISITFPGPANLAAVQSENGVHLSWNAANNAVSYNIYCNSILIATGITSTSYLDNRTIAGELTYYVKGIDNLGDESDASETATINVAYSTPIVNSLSAMLTNNDATLTWTAPDWCYPETHSNILTYGTGTPKGSFGYNNGTTKMYWGHRYFSSNLGSYNGFVLYKVSFYAKESGRYKIFVYQGTTSDAPQTMVLEQSINITTDSWNEIDLQNPIIIDSSQDLWVFIYDDEARSYAAVHSGEYSGDGNYYYYTDPTLGVWSLNRAFLIRTYLSDGTYTYNLYRDGAVVAEGLTETSYNANLNDNAANLFTVKTNYYGGETAASNTIGFAKGTASVTNLKMAANDKMTVAENSSLTVTGTLSNDNPENLILENGAQLIHSSNGVKATVKKARKPSYLILAMTTAGTSSLRPSLRTSFRTKKTVF